MSDLKTRNRSDGAGLRWKVVRAPAGCILALLSYKIPSHILSCSVGVQGLPMDGSLHDIHGPSDQNVPQEDPNRRKFSSQYSVSTHSVPVKRTHQISKTGDNSRKQSHPGKHRRRRHHRRNKHPDREETVNPSDIVAEILGKKHKNLQKYECFMALFRRL